MKQRNIFATVAISAMLLASCNDAFNSTEEHVYAQTLKSRSAGDSVQSYNVSEALVQTYVHLTSPNRTVSSITPIIRNVNDTLAYVVQYAQGWDLISGDTRMAPRLAYNATDTFNMVDYAQNGAGGVLGMIDLVAEKRLSNDTILNPTWKFLLPRTEIINPIVPRNVVAGMWIPIDTICDIDQNCITHLLSTNWSQDAPYNNYCPMIGNSHTLAGCGPVAVGQIVASYLSVRNPGDVEVPSSCTMVNGYPVFSDYSDTQWSNILSSSNAQAVFLSYLGTHIMNASYGNNLTTVYTRYCDSVFHWANINYTKDTYYNINGIISSLCSRKPVLVSAQENQFSPVGHAFIIDAYDYNYVSIKTCYVWVEGYHPSDYEFLTSPMWMFDPPQKDDEVIEEETVLQHEHSIAMNWGYGANYNNTYYTIYSGVAQQIDDNCVHSYYSPNWEIDGNTYTYVNACYYNLFLPQN